MIAITSAAIRRSISLLYVPGTACWVIGIVYRDLSVRSGSAAGNRSTETKGIQDVTSVCGRFLTEEHNLKECSQSSAPSICAASSSEIGTPPLINPWNMNTAIDTEKPRCMNINVALWFRIPNVPRR